MIPKVIWQTYEVEYAFLPENIKEYIESWKNNYKEFEYNYMDSKQREQFVLDNFGRDWYSIFTNLPLNIMRSNLWRYMILYVYGGLYFDLDTSPIYNINDWLKDEYDIILFADESEPEMLFYIQVLSSKANNPILKNIIDDLFVLFNSEDYNKSTTYDKYFVFKYGGEVSTINSIRKALDPNKTIPNISNHAQYNFSENAKMYKFYCYANDYDVFSGKAFNNIDGANNWKEGYTSWWKEAENRGINK